jgi:hypothetical protein
MTKVEPIDERFEDFSYIKFWFELLLVFIIEAVTAFFTNSLKDDQGIVSLI